MKLGARVQVRSAAKDGQLRKGDKVVVLATNARGTAAMVQKLDAQGKRVAHVSDWVAVEDLEGDLESAG